MSLTDEIEIRNRIAYRRIEMADPNNVLDLGNLRTPGDFRKVFPDLDLVERQSIVHLPCGHNAPVNTTVPAPRSASSDEMTREVGQRVKGMTDLIEAGKLSLGPCPTCGVDPLPFPTLPSDLFGGAANER